jgi:hypothetical protein
MRVGMSHGMRNELTQRSRTGVRASFMALTFARGSRAVAHATAFDAIHCAVHGTFMTLPPYNRSREGEMQELGGVVRTPSGRAFQSGNALRKERQCLMTEPHLY